MKPWIPQFDKSAPKPKRKRGRPRIPRYECVECNKEFKDDDICTVCYKCADCQDIANKMLMNNDCEWCSS